MSSKLLCVVGLFFMITMQLPSVLAQTGDDVLTTETIVVSENTADTVLGRYIADKARALSAM